ncbi:MAG: glycoside hydrolase family 13 protein [Kosmotoga sp.]|nr:MAG: glycoside hydrolase family 13 protein [Kosmotoga sp.]
MKRFLTVLIILASLVTLGYQIEVIHDQNDRTYFNPVQPGEIYFTVSIEKMKDIKTEKILLVTDEKEFELSYLRETENTIFYRTKISDCEFEEYFFEIMVGKDIYYFDQNGISSEEVVEPFRFKKEKPPVDYFDPPEWSKGRIYYQIFPERFANGNENNDPPQTQDWYSDPESANLGSNGFFGGDLQGVINKLDYLSKLGVETIYFNPIFESISSHKYDTTDYMKIDDNFGTEETFEELIKATSKKGIDIVLDGVFNHTGTDFFAFEDIKEKGKDSEYTDWYFIRGFPVRSYAGMAMNYTGWAGYAHMPKLNVNNEEVRDYIERVVTKWGNKGIAGWRLDVANEISFEFWEDFFRPTVKKLDPSDILVAEYWGYAKNFLMGNSFDSVMNYLFRDAVIEYVARAGHSSRKFKGMTEYFLNTYPPQVLDSLWNLLGSHDTERILTALYGDVKLAKIAVTLQFTFKGSPVIYYGDEIGMKGYNDPDNRKPMHWKQEMWNKKLMDHYRTLINLRKEHSALRTGDHNVLYSEDSLFVFERVLDEEHIIVLTNPGDASMKWLPEKDYGKYVNAFDNVSITIEQGKAIEVPARSFMVISRVD